MMDAYSRDNGVVRTPGSRKGDSEPMQSASKCEIESKNVAYRGSNRPKDIEYAKYDSRSARLSPLDMADNKWKRRINDD